MTKNEETVSTVRANKITAFWAEGGVAVGNFYKTHDKVLSVKSNDEAVIKAGFKMSEGTEESPVTSQQKLEAFKTFLQVNAGVFNIQYDPVDRRADEFKFPNKYDEDSFREYSHQMAVNTISACVGKTQAGVIERMIKGGHIEAGTELCFGVAKAQDAEIEVTEAYKNGSLKYAAAQYPVVFAVGDKQIETSITIELVSGQLKKPRNIADCPLTMSAVKGLLIENGLLPKIEKLKKEEKDSEEAEAAE